MANQLMKHTEISVSQLILETVPELIAWKDVNSVYQGANTKFAKAAGFSLAKDVVGKTDAELSWGKSAETYVASDKKVLDTGKPSLNMVEYYPSKDGQHLWLDISLLPLSGDNDNIIGILVVFRDITEQTNAKLENEQLLKDISIINIELQTEIIERKKLAQEVERISQAKSEFLANMNHELRTPMHSILSFSEMGIKQSAAPFEKIQRYFQRINESGFRLLRLLNDLLDLSSLDVNKMVFEFAEAHLKQIVESCIDEQSSAIENSQLTTTIESKGDTTVVCDGIRMGQVIANLLSNAIKFSTENETITITIEPELLTSENDKSIEGVKLTVNNKESHIPEDELNNIFDKFVQSSETKTGAGGTGLGLSLCYEIIKVHQGIIWAENVVEGGVNFSFVIPVKAEDNDKKQ